MEILNLKGDPNHIIGSRDTPNLLKGWILPIGEVALRRVCTYSLRSRLVIEEFDLVRLRIFFGRLFSSKSDLSCPIWGHILTKSELLLISYPLGGNPPSPPKKKKITIKNYPPP